MKKLLFTAALLAIAAISANAVPAHNVPVYQLQVPVQFDSPEAAQKAALKFLPLPPGKSVAFSCRWDDSNSKHLTMKNLMTKYGFKGTFYLTWLQKKFVDTVLPELMKDGCTIGNHTITHFHMPLMTPNGIHYEMLYARILHEDISDQTENAFIFPYGRHTSSFFPEVPTVIASCLRRSGMLGGPDTATYKLSQIPGNEFFSSKNRDVRPGDKNTQPAKFDAHVKRHTPPAGKTAHLVLGVHTWHSDEDFIKLEESLKKYANRSDWWYCNENEFNAYSYMLNHAKVTNKVVNGNTATFTLEMPCPEFVGSEVPLWAECNGKNIEIKHSRKLPAKICHAAADGKVAEFPDVTAKLAFTAPDKVRLDITNNGKALEDAQMILRLPPDFVEESIYFNAGNITGKFSKEWTLTPAKLKVSAGKQFTAVQIDFTRNSNGGRIWASQLREIPHPDTYKAVVYCSGNEDIAKNLAQLSQVTTKLDPALFAAGQREINWQEGIFSVPYKQRNLNGLTVVMDFQGGRKMVLRTLPAKEIYCNGKLLKLEKNMVVFDAPAGKCRIAMHYGKSKSQIKIVKMLLAPAE